MRPVVGLPWKRGAILALVGLLSVLPPRSSRGEESASTGDEEEQFIEYQLRPNDDPSKVARMFHVSLDELLALNHIPDAHRLTVGTTLKIPDPRAARVKQLAGDKHVLEGQLAGTQANIGALKTTVDQLQSQVADLREANDGLRSEQMLNHVWRVVAFVAGGSAAILALGLLLVWAKAHDAERHAAVLLKEAEVTHAAIDKYRQLGAQFELKYQSLFHQVGTPSLVQGRAHALRAAYEEDRARLDAIVGDAERQIAAALAQVAPKREQGRAPAHLAAVPAGRKTN